MSNKVAPEAELIRRARRGDMAAFEELVVMHRQRVLRTAYGIVGSTQEAEDVAQEVFVKVWQKLDTFSGSSSFGSWVYRITSNAAIDRIRKRRPTVSLDEPERPVRLPDNSALPEDAALRDGRRERVQAAIMQLSPNARAALILREYEQLSYKEIAAALDIPIGTVMSRLNYARQSLKKLLEEDDQSAV